MLAFPPDPEGFDHLHVEPEKRNIHQIKRSLRPETDAQFIEEKETVLECNLHMMGQIAERKPRSRSAC
jgi:hypothetical protein